MKNKTLFLLLLILPFFSLEGSSWYEQKLQGWYYFEEQEEQGEKRKKEISPEEAVLILEEKKKELAQQLSLALLVPTPTNVEKYIRLQKRFLNQSQLFAENWGKVLLENPALGDFLENPTTSYGILAKRALEQKNTADFLKQLSDRYFLLFFFKGKDPLAELVYEVAKLFSSLHGWQIKAVSLDGISLKGIPSIELDKGLSERIGVKETPSLFAVDPANKAIYPVGAGMLSVTEIEKNIQLQLAREKDHE